jgi:hypothetical protein
LIHGKGGTPHEFKAYRTFVKKTSPMKKLMPLKSYFVRAKVFGFIVIAIVLVYLVYLIQDVLSS